MAWQDLGGDVSRPNAVPALYEAQSAELVLVQASGELGVQMDLVSFKAVRVGKMLFT